MPGTVDVASEDAAPSPIRSRPNSQGLFTQVGGKIDRFFECARNVDDGAESSKEVRVVTGLPAEARCRTTDFDSKRLTAKCVSVVQGVSNGSEGLLRPTITASHEATPLARCQKRVGLVFPHPADVS